MTGTGLHRSRKSSHLSRKELEPQSRWLHIPQPTMCFALSALHTPIYPPPQPLLSFCVFCACSSRWLSLPLSAFLPFSGILTTYLKHPSFLCLAFLLLTVLGTSHPLSEHLPNSVHLFLPHLPVLLSYSGLSLSFPPTPASPLQA